MQARIFLGFLGGGVLRRGVCPVCWNFVDFGLDVA
jgi:hypothetical protein